jgi:DNA-binding LytR/AlgR family response regulator
VLARRQINQGFETSHPFCHVSMLASSGTSSANGHMKKLMSRQGAPTVLFLDPVHLS